MKQAFALCNYSFNDVVPKGSSYGLRTVVPVQEDYPLSLLGGEEFFFNRLLTRDSSKGFSSRFYYRAACAVPFNWEAQPGKPKHSPENKKLPPLSPSPSAHNLNLPRCGKQDQRSIRSRLFFWKKGKNAERKSQRNPIQDWSWETSESFEYCYSPGSSSFASSSPSLNSPAAGKFVAGENSSGRRRWKLSGVLLSTTRRLK